MSVGLVVAMVAAAAGSASVPAASAVERLADEVRTQVLRTGPEAPVALVVEGGPVALTRAVATVAAAKLAAVKLAPMVVEVGADAEARAVAQGARTMVRVSVSVEGQKVVARGDTYSVWANFWSGRAASRSPKAGLIVAALEADTETLTLAGAALPAVVTPSTLEVKASVLAKFVGTAAAISAGDLDGDGRAELVVMVNEEVMVFSAEGRLMGRYDLALAPLAAMPTRDAFGAVAVVAGPARVVAWSAKRARAEVLSWSGGSLRATGFADAVPVDGIAVKPEPGFNHFLAEVLWAGRVVTLSAAPQTTVTRGALTLWVMADGSAALARGSGALAARVTGVGAGSTLADLDGDGVFEVVLSGNRTSGEDDVRVLSVTSVDAVAARAGTLAEATAAWQSPLARGRALAATAVDLDGVKGDEVILATALSDGTGELVVLHREAP